MPDQDIRNLPPVAEAERDAALIPASPAGGGWGVITPAEINDTTALEASIAAERQERLDSINSLAEQLQALQTGGGDPVDGITPEQLAAETAARETAIADLSARIQTLADELGQIEPGEINDAVISALVRRAELPLDAPPPHVWSVAGTETGGANSVEVIATLTYPDDTASVEGSDDTHLDVEISIEPLGYTGALPEISGISADIISSNSNPKSVVGAPVPQLTDGIVAVRFPIGRVDPADSSAKIKVAWSERGHDANIRATIHSAKIIANGELNADVEQVAREVADSEIDPLIAKIQKNSAAITRLNAGEITAAERDKVSRLAIETTLGYTPITDAYWSNVNGEVGSQAETFTPTGNKVWIGLPATLVRGHPIQIIAGATALPAGTQVDYNRNINSIDYFYIGATVTAGTEYSLSFSKGTTALALENRAREIKQKVVTITADVDTLKGIINQQVRQVLSRLGFEQAVNVTKENSDLANALPFSVTPRDDLIAELTGAVGRYRIDGTFDATHGLFAGRVHHSGAVEPTSKIIFIKDTTAGPAIGITQLVSISADGRIMAHQRIAAVPAHDEPITKHLLTSSYGEELVFAGVGSGAQDFLHNLPTAPTTVTLHTELVANGNHLASGQLDLVIPDIAQSATTNHTFQFEVYDEQSAATGHRPVELTVTWRPAHNYNGDPRLPIPAEFEITVSDLNTQFDIYQIHVTADYPTTRPVAEQPARTVEVPFIGTIDAVGDTADFVLAISSDSGNIVLTGFGNNGGQSINLGIQFADVISSNSEIRIGSADSPVSNFFAGAYSGADPTADDLGLLYPHVADPDLGLLTATEHHNNIITASARIRALDVNGQARYLDEGAGGGEMVPVSRFIVLHKEMSSWSDVLPASDIYPTAVNSSSSVLRAAPRRSFYFGPVTKNLYGVVPDEHLPMFHTAPVVNMDLVQPSDVTDDPMVAFSLSGKYEISCHFVSDISTPGGTVLTLYKVMPGTDVPIIISATGNYQTPPPLEAQSGGEYYSSAFFSLPKHQYQPSDTYYIAMTFGTRQVYYIQNLGGYLEFRRFD